LIVTGKKYFQYIGCRFQWKHSASSKYICQINSTDKMFINWTQVSGEARKEAAPVPKIKQQTLGARERRAFYECN